LSGLHPQVITLAVSATGPDRIYPARHRDLAEQITQRGAIVSEYPLGEGVHRWRFPQRNRLVAALSYGVVLIEAARRSGTLTTARHAIELGKPVMPVPGSIAHGRNSGSHDLIRDGAFLVEDTREIAALVAPAIGADLATSVCPLLEPSLQLVRHTTFDEVSRLGLHTRLDALLDYH